MDHNKEKLDEIIEKEVEKKIRSNKELKRKIDQEVDRNLDEMIKTEVKEVLGQKTAAESKEVTTETEEVIIPEEKDVPIEDIGIAETKEEVTVPEEKEIPSENLDMIETEELTAPEEKTVTPETENPEDFKKPIAALRKYFHICWKGICRPISLVMLSAYALIIILMLTCVVFHPKDICLTRNILGAGPAIMYISIIAFVISMVLSFLSSYSRTALTFSVLLSIPLVIIVFFSTIQYIGYILVSLVVFNLIIQSIRQ